MRCNNCGWQNAETDSHCVKCNSPLPVTSRPEAGARQETVAGRQETTAGRQETVAGRQETGQASRQPTVAGRQGIEEAAGTLRSVPAEAQPLREDTSVTNCPACDYPASSRLEKCPMCGSPMKAAVQRNEGTVDPFRESQQASKVSPMSEVSPTPEVPPTMFLERIGRPEESSQVLPFTATDTSEVNVSRQNLDENNFTITSRHQASFFFKDNKWWMVDRSDLQTTFIQVKEPVELQDGDIVLMGDRRFVFYSTPPGGEGTA